MKDTNGKRTPYLLTTVTFLLTALTARAVASAGIRGLEPMSGPTPDGTVAKKFFYNPPSNGGPPPDVMAMLSAGRTSGYLNSFGIRNSVSQGAHILRPTPYYTVNNFPEGHPSVVDPERDQTEHSPESSTDYDVALNWEPEKRLETDESSNFYTLTPPEIQTQTRVTEVSTLSGTGSPDSLKSELPEYEEEYPLDSTSISPSSTVWGPGETADTELPPVSSTDSFFRQSYLHSPSGPNDTLVPGTELPEDSSLGNDNPNFPLNTKLPGEAPPATEIPVDLMTMDEAEGERTTLTSAFLDSQSKQKEEIKGTDEAKKEASVNRQKINEKPGFTNQTNIEGDSGKLKEQMNQNETLEDEEEEKEKIMHKDQISKAKDAHEIGSQNSIFFTIKDESEKDGKIRVKLGKALNNNANQNAIWKSSDDAYQYHFQDPDTGWYKFGYGDSYQWRHEERRGDGIVLGRYGWHDANGKEHMTHFVADARGYRIVQPGQEIIMHVAPPSPTTTHRPFQHVGIPYPSTLTTIQPFFTQKTTSQPSSPTTAAFPITSLSTTFTLSTGQSSNKPSRPSPATSFPGTIDGLIEPDQELSVITGRPPIAYPLPHHSWIYVSPTPLPQSTNRPFVAPPFRPYRPYPTNRPIKSPFRPVNRPRPRPVRPRPLKPLQPGLHKNPASENESGEHDTSNIEATNDKPVQMNDDKNTSKPTIDDDFITKLQAFLSNPFRYPVKQPNQSETDEPPIPNKPEPVPNYQDTSDGAPAFEESSNSNQIETDNISNLSPGELMHFINLINSLNLGQKPATSVGSPAISFSPWSSNGVKVPQVQASNDPKLPSYNLQPPPISASQSFTPDFASSSIQETFSGGHQPSPYPLDYAFMDEDYALVGLKPVTHSIQNPPEGDNVQTQSLFNINRYPVQGSLFNIPGGLSPTGSSSSIDNSGKDKPSNEFTGSVTLNHPNVVPLDLNSHTMVTSQTTGWDGASGTTTANGDTSQSLSDSLKSTTLASTATTSPSKPYATSIKPPSETASSSANEEPSTDNVWPYISTLSSSSSTSSPNATTTLPPPPPPQSIWAELLKRIYYWPNAGPSKRPTIQ